MNITAMPGLMNAGKVSSEIGTAILSKNLDTMEEMGDSMIKMMEQSVYPHLGQNIDATV